jgi:hypothetical protein
VGTGKNTTLSTCGGATNYDTKLRVYCTDNSCVAGNDDNCGVQQYSSSVAFFAEVGVSYKVLVHGWSDQEGTFELSVDCGAISSDSPTSVPLSSVPSSSYPPV